MCEIKKIFMLFAFLSVMIGCQNKEVSTDFKKVERLVEEIQILKDEAMETEKELEALRDIERQYKYQFTNTPYINMNTSFFFYDLQNENVERLNEHTSDELRFEKKNGEIYAITQSYERKVTYNTDNQTLESWYIEGISFEPMDNRAEVTIRPHYSGESVAVLEARYFNLTFVKINEDWYLQDIAL
ncbi:hypothetical protein RGU12_20365 [Fredinandcohnia sp. QZ13]|uniref:hypothetical protein n=1 Tax=Fredinandcohnia sp. QZ13 TaxID=3073144 RepID=UPI0028530A64|nr:hypothetical protein [Fredinandcohnia sp. QZ13]MDR4889852.1 hypothetical protein [Fredinandcohnia sp. QZ13]